MDIEQVMKRIKEFALLPQSNLRVMSVLDDQEADLDKVGLVLSADPGLVATLLRVANSAYVGTRDEVKSLKQALVVLGLDKIRSLVIAVGLIQKFRSLPPEAARVFWMNSLLTANWSKVLCRYFPGVETDAAFLCGLLHNSGEMVIWQYFKSEQKQIDAKVQAGVKRAAAEKAVLGCTREEMGGFLFKEWKMPQAVIDSVLHQHSDINTLVNNPAIAHEARVVNMAVAICGVDTKLDAFDYDKTLNRIVDDYRAALNIDDDISPDELSPKVSDEMGKLDNFFQSSFNA